jgi:F-type H+-transporting ATPase subunit epsilon
MADTLHFSLVSPERELFSGDVAHVVVPGTEGEFGVLAHHAPLMSTIKPGLLRIFTGEREVRMFINGGFADVTPHGLTILAEDAVDLAQQDAGEIEQHLRNTQEDVVAASQDPSRLALAQQRLARLTALQAALRTASAL